MIHVYQKGTMSEDKFRVLQQLIAYRSKFFHTDDRIIVFQIINHFTAHGFHIDNFRNPDFMDSDSAFQNQTGIAVFVP